MEGAERRVPGAEVVDRESDPEAQDPLQVGQRGRAVVDDALLGHLELEPPTHLGVERPQPFEQPVRMELHRRQVDRRHRIGVPLRHQDLPGRNAAIDHLQADVVDQADLLGERDEVGRWDPLAVVEPPAGEHLDSPEAPVGDAHDRLQPALDVAAVDRGSQALLEPQPSDDVVAGRRLEQHPAAAPGALGLVHRGVGVAQHLARPLLVVDRDHADAGGELPLPPGDHHRFGESSEAPLAERGGLDARTRQHDDELVAAEAAHHAVRADGGRSRSAAAMITWSPAS